MSQRDHSGRKYGAYYERTRLMALPELAACMYRVLTRSADSVTVPTGTDFSLVHNGERKLVVAVLNLTDEFLFKGHLFSPEADAVIDSVESFLDAFNWTHRSDAHDRRFYFTVLLPDESEQKGCEYSPGVSYSTAPADH